MPVITGGKVIEGTYGGLSTAGAPVAGTNAIQTLTIGGTPTGGTFKLKFEMFTTAAITWSATNATLVANIDAALEALTNIGTAGVTTAVGTAVAGIGTITITFTGNRGLSVLTDMTAPDNSLTGTAPTLAVATTTPGVAASHRGAPIGALSVRRDTGVWHTNTGTALAPTWTVVGAQT